MFSAVFSGLFFSVDFSSFLICFPLFWYSLYSCWQFVLSYSCYFVIFSLFYSSVFTACCSVIYSAVFSLPLFVVLSLVFYFFFPNGHRIFSCYFSFGILILFRFVFSCCFRDVFLQYFPGCFRFQLWDYTSMTIVIFIKMFKV